MNEKELKQELYESLKTLEKILHDKKKRLGKKANEDPECLHLESVIKAGKFGGAKAILEVAVTDLKKKEAAPRVKQGRISLQEKIDNAYKEWIIKSKQLEFDPDGPIKKYSKESGRQRAIDQLKLSLIKNTKEWLATELAFAATRIEELNQYNASQAEEITFLADKFRSFHSSRLAAVNSQAKGKEERFKANNDCLKAAFDKFKQMLGRPIVAEDFTLYVVVLEYFFKEPPAPEISEFGGHEWAKKTVGNYFTKNTSLKPKYSKKLAAKLSREHFSDNR